MIRMSMIVMACLSLLVAAGGCDDYQTKGSGGGGGIRATADNGPVAIINGDPVPAADLLASTALRQGLRQYIYFHNLRKIAAEEGVEVDMNALEEHISLVKQRLTERGDTWEGYLGELFITEDEYRANIEESLLQDGIVEKRVGVTDDKMRGVWEDQQDKVIDEYMSTNMLPDSERGTVTYEMCHDILFTKVMRIEGVPVLGDLNKELIDTASFEITCMSDKEQAKLYEFLILESGKSTANQQEAPSDAKPESAEGPESGDDSHAQNGEGGIDSAVGG